MNKANTVNDKDNDVSDNGDDDNLWGERRQYDVITLLSAPMKSSEHKPNRNHDHFSTVWAPFTMNDDNDDNDTIINTATTFAEKQDGILLNILQYLDTPTLVEMKVVCQRWRLLCTQTIDSKPRQQQPHTQKTIFQSNMELRSAVRQYAQYNRKDAEDFACREGWPINRWDVSNVTDFSQVFEDMIDFNEDISDWDVSNATTMCLMFSNALSFNKDISRWNVSNVTCFSEMFHEAHAFNQNISKWDTSSGTDFSGMFQGAEFFNQDIISCWNTSSAIDMQRMFCGAFAFNNNNNSNKKDDIFMATTSSSKKWWWWDTSNVENMSEMFCGAESFNQDISGWNVSKLERVRGILHGAGSFQFQEELNACWWSRMANPLELWFLTDRAEREYDSDY